MISKSGSGFDIIFVTGEYYDDHPLSPAGIIARVLDAEGYSVGIIEKPVKNADFARLGKPRLFFGITSGSIDSMLNNYTPLKKKRALDSHSKATQMPDRAVIAYCNRLREQFKGVPLIIGGIEASLRRFAHYDYWDNAVRGSILLDSRAEILVYGSGEKQIVEIARRLAQGKGLDGIQGTCISARAPAKGFAELPSLDEVKRDKIKFCEMQQAFSNDRGLCQLHGLRYVLQYRSPCYTSADLDRIYSLDYSRNLNPRSLLGLARFSVVTHRGCFGSCSFCSIALHQGERIISRSEKSIIAEIQKITRHPQFKGAIDDLGGPSANMYAMDCRKPCSTASCMSCRSMDKSHRKLIALMQKARAVPGVRKVFVRSGIRYDLALSSKEYIVELSSHHLSGCLKIAPEHISEKVLRLMNKENGRLNEFIQYFRLVNQGKKQGLRYYFMIGHPGDSLDETRLLREQMKKLRNIEQFQLFTPTPMTRATCMYWTGLDPATGKKVDVVRDYRTKKQMKRMLLA